MDDWRRRLRSVPLFSFAFSRWLEASLRQQYSGVLAEPIPQHMLQLIGDG